MEPRKKGITTDRDTSLCKEGGIELIVCSGDGEEQGVAPGGCAVLELTAETQM